MAEIVRLPLGDLLANEGQVAGLPTNPRQWTKGDVEKIAKSLKDTPELFEMRPCLVYPYNGQFIVLGGNLRLEGAKKNGWKEVPAIIVPHGTSTEKLREIVIKDNGAFGAWDFDALANEWDDLPLTEWGVPAWNMGIDEDALSELFEEAKAKENAIKITIVIPEFLQDKENDIRESLAITLQDFKGCKIK